MDSVRVGATVDPPYAESCYFSYPKHCFNPGYNIEFIHMILANFLNLSVTWVNYENYIDLDKALDNGEIDINGLVYAYDLVSTKKWNYSMPAFSSTIGLIVKTRIVSKESFNLSLLAMFEPHLWLTLIVISSFLIVWKNLLKSIFKQNAPTSKVANIVLLVWSVIFSIILNLFGNLIAVDLLIPNTVVAGPFDNVVELGEKLMKKECRLVMFSINENASEFYDVLFIPTHNKSWAENFREAYKINPPLFVDTKMDLIKLVRDHDCMIGVDYTQLSGVSYYDNYCGIKCLIYLDDFEFKYYAYFFKSVNLRNIVDTIITSEAFFAYSEHVLKNYFPREKANCKSIPITGVLNLSKLLDCFVILAFGIIISAMVFIMQNVTACKKFIVKKSFRKTFRYKFA